MALYKRYYEFVTGERVWVKVEIPDDMVEKYKECDLDFLENDWKEFRRDKSATSIKFAKQSIEYAMSPEQILISKEWRECRNQQLDFLSDLDKRLLPHWLDLIEQIYVKNMKQEDVADARGVSQPAIAKQLRKIHSFLRKRLKSI